MRKISIVVLIVLLVAAPFFVSCKNKKGYKIGDKGPAGGMIFYVDKKDEYPEWDYLETSTGKDGIGEYQFGDYYVDGSRAEVGTEYGVGAGRRNTEKLVAAMGDAAWDENGNKSVSEYAAKMCADYEQNGYDDWFLPSSDELDLVYQNLQEPGLSKFSGSWCWSSSECYDFILKRYNVTRRSFGDGSQCDDYRGSYYCVRPVRAFSEGDPIPETCLVSIVSQEEPDIEPLKVRKGGMYVIPDRNQECFKVENISDQYGNTYSEGQRIVVDEDLTLTYNWVPADFGYKIGDKGPAGGMIFYVDEEDKYPEWDYLETSTGKDGIGNYQFAYFYNEARTERGIGAGKRNTENLVTKLGYAARDKDGNRIAVYEYAAKMCANYVQNGYDDWFLPSKDELNLVYQNLQKPGHVHFSGSWCWSSSEGFNRNYGYYAWAQSFDDGSQNSSYFRNGRYRKYTYCVRPVRAF